jgi:hypothetical protein
MNETTTGATKAKTAKHITDPFGMPKYEMPTRAQAIRHRFRAE